MFSGLQTPTRYLLKLAATISVLSSTVLLVNWFVDPLWYVQGNQFFPQNYSFNERYAKVNLFLKIPEQFDCILFGSSRTTLLDAAKIRSHRCYNFSYSDGSPREFVDYAKYIKSFGRTLDLVIVGVDGRYFSRKTRTYRTLDFVKELKRPPFVIKTYLSVDAFLLSVRTLLQDAPHPRYYADNFVGDVLQSAPDFVPPTCFSTEGYGRPYRLEDDNFYRTLRLVFPDAEFIGYVTPISAWDMLAPYRDNTLPTYLKTIYRLSALFDKFYDFSVPSNVTKRVENTYDGHHYSRAVNDRIAAIVSDSRPDFGMSLHDRSYVEYKIQFDRAMQAFVSEQNMEIPFGASCGRKSTSR